MPPKLNKPITSVEQVAHYWKGEPKTGKALPNGTKIYTPHGLTNIENIVVGDKILNTYGGHSTVTGVFPQGKRKLGCLLFTDGQTQEADWDHIWSVTEIKNSESEDMEITVLNLTTRELKDRLDSADDLTYVMPKYKPLEFESREVPLEQEELTYYLFSKEEKGREADTLLKTVLGDDMRLPKEYIYNSLSRRMDFICNMFNYCKLDEVNEESPLLKLPLLDYQHNLANDIITMLKTMSWDGYIDNGYLVIEVNFDSYTYFMAEYMIKLVDSKIMDRLRDYSFANYRENILFAIEEVDEEKECTCIKVDSLDSLFILENFIVTHNTTLFRDFILEQYNDPTKGLLIIFGNEMGHKSIANVLYEEIREWDKEPDEDDDSRGFVQLVDDIVENNDQYGYKFIGLDTFYRMIDVCEKFIINRSILETGKVVNSIKAACGGYQAGYYETRDEMEKQFSRLIRVGVMPIVIGHIKKRKETDSIDGEEYVRYKSEVSDIYESWLTTMTHINMVIVKEKQIEDERLIGTKPYMYFADDGYVDANTRFPDMPEKLPVSAKNYIEAFNIGVQNSLKAMSGDQIQNQENDKIEKKAHATKEKFNLKMSNFKTRSAMLIKEQKISKKDFTNLLRENNVGKIDDIKNLSQLKIIEDGIDSLIESTDDETES